jgi:tetratricopeptide (TPR) repeat protein
LGKYKQALEAHKKSLVINKKFGNKIGEGTSLGCIGNAFRGQGKYKDSIVFYKKAITIAQEIGNKSSEGTYLGNLGIIYKILGKYEQAISQYKQAIQIARQIGNKRGEGKNLGNTGNLYLELGQFEQAIEYYTQSIDIAVEIGDKTSEGIYLGNMGEVLSKLNRFEEAEISLQKSISICQHSVPLAGASFRTALAFIFAKQNKIAEVHSLLKKAEIEFPINPEEYGRFLCKKAHVLYIIGEENLAEEALLQAEEMAEKIQSDTHSEFGKLIFKIKILLSSSEKSE